MIHAFASLPQYWRHLAPIVDALRERDHEVTTWASRATQPWGARARHVPAGELALVASWVDAQQLRERPLVYVEHGAGQIYRDGPIEGYAGAPGLADVQLFLAPGEHVAARWRQEYPDAAVEVVGCPALDSHLRRICDSGLQAPASQREHQENDDDDEEQGSDADEHARTVDRARDSGALRTMSVVGARYNGDRGRAAVNGERTDDRLRPRGAPVVAVTSHWRCGVTPETMPALPLFERALRELRETHFDHMIEIRFLGHAHPRNVMRAQAMFDRLDLELEVDPDIVLAQLAKSCQPLLVADNTSLLYEAAALDVPVLCLNAPNYRRDVEHGLRFWSHVPGLQCDEPKNFASSLVHALDDPPEAQLLRHRAADHVYAHRDGRSAERAAVAIEGLL